jgi:hypothetical protein
VYGAHLLLGRPWQFDKKAKHDGFKNKYTPKKDRKTYMFESLSPKQVYEDQLKLKKSRRN